MYEIILFLVKLMIDPPSGFCLEEYITHVSSYTRASSHNMIKQTYPLVPHLNITKNLELLEFVNSLPPMTPNAPFLPSNDVSSISSGKYFILSYSVDNPRLWFVACPCANYSCLPITPLIFTSQAYVADFIVGTLINKQ